MPRLELRIKGLDERRERNPRTGETLVVRGRSEPLQFFEVELRGQVVQVASGGSNQATRVRQTEHASEDEAYAAYAKAIVAKRKRGFVEVGGSRELEGAVPEPFGSFVLLEVYYSAGDPRFLEELRRTRGPKKLAGFAARWFDDQRPFARRMMLAYLDEGCAWVDHKALVKQLFKLAEAAKDHELMARFLVAFDRWNRRSLQTIGYRWDPVRRTSERELGLREDPLIAEAIPKGKQSPEFSRVTRRYLARRCFRYFRRLGYRDPETYRQVMVQALTAYREEHLNTVGKLLSAWSLLHVLYGRSKVLSRRPKGIGLAIGCNLAELKPAPLFPEAWAAAFDDLLTLLTSAGSLTVRGWASSLLQEDHQASLAQLPFSRIKSLLVATNAEAQALGVSLFNQQASLDDLTQKDWFELLAIENLEVLAAVCERATQSMDCQALSLGACVRWVLSPAAPLARLAFGFCRTKAVDTPDALDSVLRCCQARVEAVRREATAYCADLLTRLPFATMEQIRDLCDSEYRDVRVQGLKTAQLRFAQHVELWTALCESPYKDVRHHVVERATHFRSSHPDSLTHVFGTVLLSLQGAAKDKRRVTRELVDRISVEPERASALLPLLRTLLRSIHPVERGLALGALARVAASNETARAIVEATIPGFSLASSVSQ